MFTYAQLSLLLIDPAPEWIEDLLAAYEPEPAEAEATTHA